MLFFTSCTKTKTRISTKSESYVANSKEAINIAEEAWLPIYGTDIYKEKPFHAELQGDSIWFVSGTLPEGVGGTVEVEIMRSNGKIIRVSHGK